MAFDPELHAAIAARIQYFRDLGVFDFYRRGAVIPEAELEGYSAALTDTSSPLQEPGIPVRKSPRPSSEDNAHTTSGVISGIAAAIAPPDHAAQLLAIRADLGECQRCPLAATRNKIVYGDGDPDARLLFVGEGPGADEDAQGLPFVGRGGQLLNNMINAMGLKREQVYIANIVKCRPPQNRVPEPVEANTCSPFLFRQIDAVRPQVIVALGSTAATYLLGVKSPLSALRGRLHDFHGSRLIVTYHPAYLLRDPNQKKAAWTDLQLAMRELGLRPPPRTDPLAGSGGEA